MKRLIVGVALAASAHAFAGSPLQSAMKSHFQSVSDIFRDMYAPTEWKKEFAGWDLQQQTDAVMLKLDSADKVTVKEYQKFLRDFFYSTKDYHVGFRFYSTEKASLPLTIRGAEGRYFIAYIDRDKLSKASFPFSIGDEVISFDGRPIQEVVDYIKTEIDNNVKETDQALAEYTLTRRRGSRAQEVPQGPITLGFIKKGAEQATEYQLAWEYTAETVDYSVVENVFNTPASSFNNFTFVDKSLANKLKSAKMTSMNAIDLASEFDTAKNPHQIGGKKSFIPSLGQKIWESSKDSSFDAYIYLNDDRKLIGYVRIPSYGAGEKESFEFAKIIQKFESQTDALVIDQVNNPGGSVFYLYSLVSMLTDKAVGTPKHQMTIFPNDVIEASLNLPQLRAVTTDEQAIKLLEAKTIGGYPVSVTFVKFMVAYYEFIISEYEEGRLLTKPYHIWGVDKINPHPTANYSKPVLLLVNELDFSGGDFFPATLQDSNLVTVMGTRTAGAGGYVLRQEAPNMFGLELFSLTGSLAERVNGNPIENLGVTPDIEYQLSATDWQENFKEYVAKIKEEVKNLYTEDKADDSEDKSEEVPEA